MLFGPCDLRIDPSGAQPTGDNQCPRTATEPGNLRLGQRNPAGAWGGSDHGCHGRVEREMAGVNAKNIVYCLDGGNAGGMRGRGGKDLAKNVFVDGQQIQRTSVLFPRRDYMTGKQKPRLASADGPPHRQAQPSGCIKPAFMTAKDHRWIWHGGVRSRAKCVYNAGSCRPLCDPDGCRLHVDPVKLARLDALLPQYLHSYWDFSAPS